MKRRCVITQTEFETRNRDDQVCPPIADAIVEVIARDSSLRRRVSADILGDSEIMSEIAKAVLAVNATEIGLSSPGTIGEFFLELRADLADSKA